MARQNHIFRKIRKGSQAEKLADVLIERPVSSKVRSFNTVDALAATGMGLKVTCTSCKTVSSYGASEIVATFGGDTPLVDVKPACASCSSAVTQAMPYTG